MGFKVIGIQRLSFCLLIIVSFAPRVTSNKGNRTLTKNYSEMHHILTYICYKTTGWETYYWTSILQVVVCSNPSNTF